MAVIKDRARQRKVPVTFRIRPDLLQAIERVAKEKRETKTYVLESFLEYGLKAYLRSKGPAE
jgi:predicted transcriptional regulator